MIIADACGFMPTKSRCRSARYNAAVLRRVFTLTSSLSLLLCAATAVLWVWSYWSEIGIGAEPPPHSTTLYMLDSERGAFTFSISNGTDDLRLMGGGWDISFFHYPSDPDNHIFCRTWYRRLWFHHESFFRPWRGEVSIPHWAVMVATGLIPLARRWAGRTETGHCSVCGYDLRATPDLCPECGTPAEKTAEASA